MQTTWYDTVTTLGWLAGITERVRLLSHVYVLAYRHPLHTAKSFMTLDELSGGRAVLGAGVGHLQREFELLGLDYEVRGAMARRVDRRHPRRVHDEYPDVTTPRFGHIYDAGMAPRPVRPGCRSGWAGRRRRHCDGRRSGATAGCRRARHATRCRGRSRTCSSTASR